MVDLEGSVLAPVFIYTPQIHADINEIRMLASQFGPSSRPFVIHIRNESDVVQIKFDEFVDIGVEADGQLHLSHFKLMDPPQHRKAEWIIDVFENSRECGIDITAGQYPYRAGLTVLTSHLLSWSRADSTERILGYLEVETSRARTREHLEEQREGRDRVVVYYVTSEENAYFEGIAHVLVCGTFVVRDGEITNETPGKSSERAWPTFDRREDPRTRNRNRNLARHDRIRRG